MDTLYFRITGVATTLDVGLSMVLTNYWGGYYMDGG